MSKFITVLLCFCTVVSFICFGMGVVSLFSYLSLGLSVYIWPLIMVVCSGISFVGCLWLLFKI